MSATVEVNLKGDSAWSRCLYGDVRTFRTIRLRVARHESSWIQPRFMERRATHPHHSEHSYRSPISTPPGFRANLKRAAHLYQLDCARLVRIINQYSDIVYDPVLQERLRVARLFSRPLLVQGQSATALYVGSRWPREPIRRDHSSDWSPPNRALFARSATAGPMTLGYTPPPSATSRRSGAGHVNQSILRHHDGCDLRMDCRQTGTKEITPRSISRGVKVGSSSFATRASRYPRADDFKLKAMWDVLLAKMVRRGVPVKNLTPGEIQPAAGSTVRQEIELTQGISSDTARAIVKFLKDRKLKKVQASIQGEQVRITSPSRDELQAVMALLKQQDYGIELKFGNYRSG